MNEKTMRGQVDPSLYHLAMDCIGKTWFEGREFDLFKGHRNNILSLLRDFVKEKDMTFVGLGSFAETRSQCVVEAALEGMFKDDDAYDWAFDATGIGTYDEVFPETASVGVRLDEKPDHWMYLAGFVEVGGSNNLRRTYFADINGKARSRMQMQYSARIGDMALHYINPGMYFKERGTFNIDMEFEQAMTVEIEPLAIHILPQEIASSATPGEYVTEA